MGKTLNELRWLAHDKYEWPILVCVYISQETESGGDAHNVCWSPKPHRIDDVHGL